MICRSLGRSWLKFSSITIAPLRRPQTRQLARKLGPPQIWNRFRCLILHSRGQIGSAEVTLVRKPPIVRVLLGK
jgi:hypothetical protein